MAQYGLKMAQYGTGEVLKDAWGERGARENLVKPLLAPGAPRVWYYIFS